MNEDGRMTPEELLSELELLNHSARIRRMVEFGYLAVGNVSIAALLADLEQGDFYRRWLALQSGGQVDWRRLARLHAAIAGAALLRRAGEAERLDQRLAWLANAILPTLADAQP